MTIAIGNDHVGYEMKHMLINYLSELGHEIEDFGANSSQSTDYPIYGKRVADAVSSGRCELGILICGTGVGISLAANKVAGIRAAVCSEPYTAKMARAHNNANIIAFGARVIGIDMAKMIVHEFSTTKFEAGRHAHRVNLIDQIENGMEL